MRVRLILEPGFSTYLLPVGMSWMGITQRRGGVDGALKVLGIKLICTLLPGKLERIRLTVYVLPCSSALVAYAVMWPHFQLI